MNSVAVNGTLRESTGKKSTKATRKAGNVPCVIYGGNEVIHFSASQISFRDLIYTPDFNIAEITVNGNTHKCILKSVSFHPVTDAVQHIDFLELSNDRTFKVDLPVRMKGTSPGVKAGGKVVTKLRRVKVKTSLEALTDELLVDISNLELGQSVRVRDIDLPEGMELLNPLAIPVASVEIPRALKSAQSEAAAEEGEDSEGEAAAE